VNELARWGGTIPWEVFTNITYRVPRVYRGSQAA
jgi:alanine racemase